MLPEFDLSGGVALVTGGNGGIGLGMAVGLAQARAAVVIAGRNEEKNAAAVKQIEAAGGRGLAVRCDVLERPDIDRAVTSAVQTFGRLTILVNNAGITRRGMPHNMTEADWDAVLDTNLKAAFLCAQRAYPELVRNGGGKIINNASEYAIFGSVRSFAYSSSKGGVVQLTKSLACAWAKDNIQVNAVLPGIIRTNIWGSLLENPAVHDRFVRVTPAGRIGEPEDLAGVAVFLASRASDFITGQVIPVDGGVCIADPLVL